MSFLDRAAPLLFEKPSRCFEMLFRFVGNARPLLENVKWLEGKMSDLLHSKFVQRASAVQMSAKPDQAGDRTRREGARNFVVLHRILPTALLCFGLVDVSRESKRAPESAAA